MTSTSMNREQLNNAIAEIGRRVIEDPSYQAGLDQDPVKVLKEAGLSDATLANLLQDEGVEQAEVAGYLAGGFTTQEPGSGIIAFTVCVGTCKSATIIVSCPNTLRR